MGILRKTYEEKLRSKKISDIVVESVKKDLWNVLKLGETTIDINERIKLLSDELTKRVDEEIDKQKKQ